MNFRRLGKTNLDVSVIGVGTWQFGGEWGKSFDQKEATAILRRAKEHGINLIDTAECYGDHTSEKLIGNAIKGERDDWIIATKFGHEFHRNFERTDRYDVDSVVKQLEDSLKALQTDYIDIYQFHSGPNDAFDNPALWEMLALEKEKGKIRHLGISVSPNTNLHQVSQASKVGAEVIQIVYNRLDRAPEGAVFPSCVAQDLGVLSRVPLASGFLSGKYEPGHKFTDPNDVRSLRDNEEIQEKLQRVAEIKVKEVLPGVDMAAWALAWCLGNPAVNAVIPGMKSVDQVDSSIKALRWKQDIK